MLGEWGFRRLELRVDSRVLIPRPETESLVERCLELLAGLPEPRVLDIGVGSGAIALAIADEHPGARVVATDSSTDALAVADENRRRTGLTGRVELVPGALFAGLEGPFDLVVSNPPYVAPDEVDGLEPEVARYEPREALVACGAMEAIAQEAPSRLAPGGSLVLETADGEAPAQLPSCSRGSDTKRCRSARTWPDANGLWMDARLVDDAVEALRAGKPVVLATDTVYGLVRDAVPARSRSRSCTG